MSPVNRTVPELFLTMPSDEGSNAYRTLFEVRSESAAQAREWSEGLWRDFYDLADPQFLDRFPIEIHQRWFEMYMGTSLRRAGLHVEAPKPGPDFRVVVGSRRIFIEAIAPTGGNPLHADAVREPNHREADGTPRAVQVPHTKICTSDRRCVQAKGRRVRQVSAWRPRRQRRPVHRGNQPS